MTALQFVNTTFDLGEDVTNPYWLHPPLDQVGFKGLAA